MTKHCTNHFSTLLDSRLVDLVGPVKQEPGIQQRLPFIGLPFYVYLIPRSATFPATSRARVLERAT